MDYPINSISGDQTSMMQSIIDAKLLQRADQATTMTERQKVKDEFLALFYKEILKQAFDSPSFSTYGEEENSMSAMFTSDIMVGKMAEQLVKSKAFSAENFFPAASNSSIPIEVRKDFNIQ